MKTNIEKLPKSTIKLTITLENDKVKESYDKILNKAIQNTEIEGFRKGTAPKEMVKDKIGVSTLYGDALNDLLQTYYPQALKENHISPVSNPKVEVKEFNLEKDLEFSATFAVRPEVKMKDYKKALKAYYEEKKEKTEKENIKDTKKTDEKPKEDKKEESKDEHKNHVHLGPNEIIEVLLRQSEVEIADLLIEEETDRMLAKLMDQLKSINLSVEKYLAAQNKTAESLRKEYDLSSEKNIKAEFVLSHLINEEKIEVTDKEIDDMIGAIGDKALGEKMNSPMERLYIKTVLQKNKLIQKLIEETEGVKHE
ncbi:MAG: trigger factor [Patescibacteria group bacterium]